MEKQHYDIIIVGSGQSGDPLARAFARAGQLVALIERENVGGTCANTGCTPTKTMIASARVAHLTRRAGDYGVHFTGAVTVDMARVRERKRAIVKDFRDGTQEQLENTPNLDLIWGEAKFTGPQSIRIALRGGGTREISSSRIVLNTGARASLPPVDGLDTVPFLDHAGMEELDTVPEHLVILGGGYIALEFGQMFRRFGSKVTIVESSSRLLEREDDDVSSEIEKILREDGIEVLCGSKAVRADCAGAEIRLSVQSGQREEIVRGSHLLVATGRTPNSDTLDLDKAGVATDKHGNILANSRLETNVPGIWAMGDVKGGPQFTHISYDDFRILKENLLNDGHRSTDDRPVPYTMFTDPQIGRVGMTEREARDKKIDITIAKLPMTQVARALETDETRGFMKAVLDKKSGQILGFACLSIDGGEVMAVVETAMMGKLPYTALKDGVFAHPTLAESLNNLFMTLD